MNQAKNISYDKFIVIFALYKYFIAHQENNISLRQNYRKFCFVVVSSKESTLILRKIFVGFTAPPTSPRSTSPT